MLNHVKTAAKHMLRTVDAIHVQITRPGLRAVEIEYHDELCRRGDHGSCRLYDFTALHEGDAVRKVEALAVHLDLDLLPQGAGRRLDALHVHGRNVLLDDK